MKKCEFLNNLDEAVKRLNGNWHLIFGNYEQKDLQDKFGGDIDKFKTYLLGLGFSNISTNCNSIFYYGIDNIF